jgi:hypothetical protein
MDVLTAANLALKLAVEDGSVFALWLEPGDEFPELDEKEEPLYDQFRAQQTSDVDAFTVRCV